MEPTRPPINLRLVPVPLRWWQVIERVAVRAWDRSHDVPCDHPFPIVGDARSIHGLRCGVCFHPCRWVGSRDPEP